MQGAGEMVGGVTERMCACETKRGRERGGEEGEVRVCVCVVCVCVCVCVCVQQSNNTNCLEHSFIIMYLF